MPVPLLVVGFLAAWVGHAYVWTAGLNYLYAKPLPKAVLKPWRYFTGLVILAFPGLALAPESPPVVAYLAVCLAFGAGVFPAVTAYRLLRKPPAALRAESTVTLDLWAELGPGVRGDGKMAWAARLPFNGIFRADFTDLTLAPPGLPAAWDGLTVLLLSDVHFHGTPARAYFERVVAEIEARWPVPDLVCLAGDYVDTDAHHAWIGPLLGRLTAREAKLAILGNHDGHHHPEQIRAALAAAGYRVLGNGWAEVPIRGERAVVVGHEGPWFARRRT